MKLEHMRCGLELKFTGSDDGARVGTFKGYGAVFNNVDQGGDIIAPGAFKATLKEWRGRGKRPKMLLQHGGFFGPAEDGIPIGKYTEMEEDEKGLYLEGELFALDTQKGKYIYEGVKSGELDGLSIGYEVVDVTLGRKPEEPRRTLKKLNLFEVSIVTFPMNRKATVESAKAIEHLQNLADAETYLRDACGFSRQQAVAFVSRVKRLRPSDSETAKVVEVNAIGAQLMSRIRNYR
jgi:HK97 family phage prohead protease